MHRLSKISYPDIIMFFCFSLIAGLVFSPVILSVAMISLVVLGLLQLELNKGIPRFRFNKPGLRRLSKIWKYPAFFVITFFFLAAAIRFYPLGDSSYFFQRLRIKVPFLFFPLAFLALPRFTLPRLKLILYFLLFTMTTVSIGILVNYFVHFDYYTELIKQGHHIPTPRSHIRYSLLSAWAVMCGIYLYLQKYTLRYKWERWCIAVATVFLIISLHILSVKSGLLLLYCSLGFALLQYIWISRAYVPGLIGLVLLVSLPIVAFNTMPSFKNKINYFIHDMIMFTDGEGANYSDSGRLVSLEAGWNIAKENWLWGVGTANIRDEVRMAFEEKYADYPEVFMPQNQFLFSWAATGIFGMLIVVFAFFFPVFHQKNYRHWLFLNFYASIFVIIMIEHALENAVGVAHYLFFFFVFLSYLTPVEMVQEHPE